HHRGEKREYPRGAEAGGEKGKYIRNYRGEDPMGEAADGLPVCAYLVGEYLRNKYPDHTSLAYGMGSDEQEDEIRQVGGTDHAPGKGPGDQGQRYQITHRADVHQF